MCIPLLLDGVFCICLLGSLDLYCCSNLLFPYCFSIWIIYPLLRVMKSVLKIGCAFFFCKALHIFMFWNSSLFITTLCGSKGLEKWWPIYRWLNGGQVNQDLEYTKVHSKTRSRPLCCWLPVQTLWYTVMLHSWAEKCVLFLIVKCSENSVRTEEWPQSLWMIPLTPRSELEYGE